MSEYTLRILSEKELSMMKDIVHILRQLGITENLDGFEYLREAIFIAAKDPSVLSQVTKEVYPEIANMYGKTADCVEHSMRYAIDKGWRNSDVDYIYERFCVSVKTIAKPTIKFFVKNIAMEVRLTHSLGNL